MMRREITLERTGRSPFAERCNSQVFTMALSLLLLLVMLIGCSGGEGKGANTNGNDNDASTAQCGDGIVSGTEECDDSNHLSGDGCSADCMFESDCGDAICETALGESCSRCRVDCCPLCGDGQLDPDEECDDGNNINGDGCSLDCNLEGSNPECGNGIQEAGEECDDGNLVAEDGCSPQCEVEFTCGDGVCDRAAGESCQSCQPECCPNCGNNVYEPAHLEQCDGSDFFGHTCADFSFNGGTLQCTQFCEWDFSQCQGTGAVCGNSIAEWNEQCDGTDLKSLTCQTFGYTSGPLSCSPGCDLDLSGCTGFAAYLDESFESAGGIASWRLEADWDRGLPNTNVGGPPAAATGQYCLGTNVTGGTSCTTVGFTPPIGDPRCEAATPWIDLRFATQPFLRFSVWYSTPGSPVVCATVMATTQDQTVNYQQLTNPSVPFNGQTGLYDCWHGTSSQWQEVIFDVGAYVGNIVFFSFVVSSDGFGGFGGMYVDDVYVSEGPP